MAETKSIVVPPRVKDRTGGTLRTQMPEYWVWCDVRRRCRDRKRPGAHKYVDRGIAVCHTWLASFDAFYKDMGPRPSPQHSIERIDNNGDYCPSNCKWATMHEQRRNTRRNHNLTFNGVTMCLTDWATRLGMSQATLTKRLKRGWSVERALTVPLHQQPSLQRVAVER